MVALAFDAAAYKPANDTDWSALMQPVAKQLLGPPNARLSSGSNWRYGNHGSLSIDVQRGVWTDHENNCGGGVIQFVASQIGSSEGDAVLWLRNEGFLEGSQPPSRASSEFFDYRDDAGAVSYRVERTSKKDFFQHGPDGRGGFARFKGCMNGVERLPYRLPELLAAPPDEPVFVVEGERCCEHLRALGFAATTNSGGAGKWSAGWGERYFRDRIVIILPDNDDAGRNHAAAIEADLKGSAASIAIVELPGLPPKGDIVDWLAMGNSASDLEAVSTAALSLLPAEPGLSERASAIPFQHFRDIRPNLNQLWLVEQLVPSGGFALVYGAPGTGKSFMTLDMVLHLAGGLPWLDRDTRACGVVYVSAEGQEGIKRRIEAYRRHHEPSGDLPFALIPAQLDLLTQDADLEPLIELIEAHAGQFGCELGLVVIDTLSRTFGGGDENTSEMATYVANLGKLQRRLDTGVLVVHHAPKDQANDTPRGHGSLLAAVDTCIKVSGSKDPRNVRVVKQKDGSSEVEFQFRLEAVEIGQDLKGEPVYSCVVVPDANYGGILSQVRTPTRSRASQLSGTVRIVFQQLEELSVAGAGSSIVLEEVRLQCRDTVPVMISEWRASALRALHDPEVKEDSTRKAFVRAKDKLLAEGIVGTCDGWAWIKQLPWDRK